MDYLGEGGSSPMPLLVAAARWLRHNWAKFLQLGGWLFVALLVLLRIVDAEKLAPKVSDLGGVMLLLAILLGIAIILLLVVTVHVRVIRFAAQGLLPDKPLLEGVFDRRTWRYIKVRAIILIQMAALGCVVGLPLLVLVLASSGQGEARQALINFSVNFGVLLIKLVATAFMAVRYALSMPAASLSERVILEDLSTAGAPYRWQFIWLVLLTVGAPDLALQAVQLAERSGLAAVATARTAETLVFAVSVATEILLLVAVALAYQDLEPRIDAARIERERKAKELAARMRGPAGSGSVAPAGQAAGDKPAAGSGGSDRAASVPGANET